MAIDPDVQILLDEANGRLATLEGGNGFHTHQGSNGGPLVDVGIRYVTEGGDDKKDGLSWGSAKATIMSAALDLNSAGLIQVGAGIFHEPAGIPWKQGMTIQGISSAATDVRLDDGEDADLFVSDPGLPGTEFLHWAKIRDMKIRIGNNPNFSANLIQFNCRVGEDNVIENVILHPGNVGIQVTRGGQPIFWSNIHSFGGNIDSAIKLQRTTGDVFNSVVLQNISGDNNGTALIYAQGFVNPKVENLTIIGVKSEAGTHQRDTIILHGVVTPTLIIGASVYDTGGIANSLVKFVPTQFKNGPVTLMSCVGGMTHWIDDQDLGVQITKVSAAETITSLTYHNGQVINRVDPT